MSSISLQKGIIYGPVFSRRLGRSLGINLLPTDHKICSFDCVYCQYGRTDEPTLSPDSTALPSISDILSAVEKALKKPHSLDALTFSGNGEPTLHPNFLEIVREVIRLKDKYRPKVKLALFTNSTTVMEPDILEAISLIDMPMMKLDAGDENTFKALNQPVTGLKLKDILEGLKDMKALIIQSVLIDGVVSNSHGEPYANWAATLAALHPHPVHIYSTERPTASDRVICLSPKRLKNIQADLHDHYGLNVEAYWRE